MIARHSCRNPGFNPVQAQQTHPLQRVSTCSPDPRFRHPAYELLRDVVRQELGRAGFLDEEGRLLLVSSGVDAVADRACCSARTLRRRFAAAGLSVRESVRRIRRGVTVAAGRHRVPTSVVAKWLGFRSADTYRKFVRREMGVSVKSFRRGVRESPVFPGLHASSPLRDAGLPGTMSAARVRAEMRMP